MVSNDIIDIAYTRLHSDWQRRGFLHKIFNGEEQDMILSVSDPFSLVWRLWSMKESIYKLQMDATSVHKYNPSKISCHIIDEINGTVSIDHQTYDTTTNQTAEYIYTYAVKDNRSEIIHKIININSSEQQSELCYNRLINEVSIQLGLNPDKLTIRKSSNGIPSLYFQENKLDIDISITHHGSFGAYSIAYGMQ